MQQPIRLAILLVALVVCAGCSHFHQFHAPPEEPTSHFAAPPQGAAEELTGPAIKQAPGQHEESDPILKEPERERWPGGSAADEYEPDDRVADTEQPTS